MFRGTTSTGESVRMGQVRHRDRLRLGVATVVKKQSAIPTFDDGDLGTRAGSLY